VIDYPANRPRPSVAEGQRFWLWGVGIARIIVLSLAGVGTYLLGTYLGGVGPLLVALYGFSLATSLFYLVSLWRGKHIPLLLTWTQTLVDFGVVAATVSFTGGTQSLFTFLFVIVILETGLLLGFAQGFLFATLAAIFMFIQAATPPLALTHPAVDQWVELWYRFLIQGLAFYLTAFVSGYWNQRTHRMEQFQKQILDNMNSGFVMTDQNGIVIVQNRGANEILGMAEGAAIGRPVEQILRVASGSECPILTVLRARRDYLSYEFFALTESNETKLLGLTTSQTYDSRKRLTGVIASFTDLTEFGVMRQELQRQDRLAAVGELAAGLAHEIRNPVAAIRGAVDELGSSLDSPQLAEQLGGIAIRECDHLNEIVSGFLAFARNPCLRKENLDLREVALNVKDLLIHEYGHEGSCEIRCVLPEHACCISGDPSQIKQVFVNLSKNGLQSMEGQGSLVITIVPSSGSFEIRFDDEGPGIAPDRITRIFEPFYTEKEKGVGMGLAVCSRIVTAHDGIIRAASREGGGATLMVRLPAAQGEE